MSLKEYFKNPPRPIIDAEFEETVDKARKFGILDLTAERNIRIRTKFIELRKLCKTYQVALELLSENYFLSTEMIKKIVRGIRKKDLQNPTNRYFKNLYKNYTIKK